MAKTSRVPTWKIPFDKETGALLYDRVPKHQEYNAKDYNWKEHDFQMFGVMRCKYRYNDMMLTDLATEFKYKMFMDNFEEMMMNNTLVKGTISGNWSFRKHGNEIGIVYKGLGN